MPLPDDLASELAAYVAPLNPRMPIFPLPKGKGAEMLQADLAVAGIPYVDASGQFFDFHSLRCQMATLADKAGVSPRVVQRLMRHSSLKLTGRYTRPRTVDIENAASMLPSLKPSGDRPDSLAATGTEGRFAARHSSDSTSPAALDAGNSSVERQRISEGFAAYLPCAGDVSSRDLSVADAMAGSDIQESMEGKPLKTGDLSQAVVSGRDLSPEAPVGVEPTYNGFADRPCDGVKAKPAKGLRIASPPVAHHLPTDTCQTDPDVARIVDAWPGLPEAVRASILMLVKAAGK